MSLNGLNDDDSFTSSSALILEAPQLVPSWGAICGVALPSSVFNVAAPLLSTGQTSLLGHGGGAIALAAYGSVSTTVSLATRVSTFLCDASSAKCGAAIGARDWAKLVRSILTSILFALLLGLVSILVLLVLKPYVFARILSLQGQVLAAAEEYFVLALCKVPFTLIGLSVSGTLQGFRQAQAVATSSIFFSGLEFALDCMAKYVYPERSLLWKFGVVGIAVAAVQTMWGVAMLLKLKPAEADDEFSLWQELRERLIQDKSDRASDVLEGEDVDGDTLASRERELGSIFQFKNGMTDMLIRSLVMQGTFALALFCVSRLPSPTTALAAHHIITNVWMLISYFVDGFSAASIVLGSRLRAQSDKAALTTLTVRCLFAGLAAGVATCLGLLVGREHVLDFYVGKDGEDGAQATRSLLRTAWILLATVQPLNGVVFVVDGILCGGQDFSYISRAYVLGFASVFLPLIFSPLKSSLLGIWGTKAVFNVYRCAAALHWLVSDMKSQER